MTDKRNITGIVLMGGKSSRMGADKAYSRIGNKTLLENSYELLKEFCRDVIFSTGNNVVQTIPGQKNIPDEKQGLGPIGGIYSCLKHSETGTNIIIAVDIPFIDRRLIKFLLENYNNTDLLIPATHSNGIEPLCGIYNKSVLPLIELMINQNDLKVQNLVNYCNSKILRITKEMEFYDDRLFLNINTPEDLKSLQN